VSAYDIGVRSNGLRRRRGVEKAVAAVAVLAAMLAVGALAVVLGSVLLKGASQLDLSFFTRPRPLFGEQGGIADALVGSALMLLMCAAVAIPFAVLVAIYMSEYAGPRVAALLRIALDVLNGVPAIVVGIFVFGLLVVGHGQSAIYGAFALAILMVPMVARATQEVLGVIPRSLREASLALGVTRWRTTWSIVLPSAIGGILTGVVIAVARVAGETAPLLFTSSLVGSDVSWNPQHALQSVPVAIFEASEQADPTLHAQAWAAATVLLAFILVTSLAARALAARSRRRIATSR
jgi:phosphate transport system permease protein